MWDFHGNGIRGGGGVFIGKGLIPPPPPPPSTLPDPVPATGVLPRRGPDTSTLGKIIYNMQSQSYDICVVPEEEVAYERWSPTGGSSVVVIGGPH